LVFNGIGSKAMAYKIDAPLIVDGKANPNRHIQIGNWRGPIALDGDIDAQVDALLDLDNDERAALKVEVREGWTQLQARSEFEIADYVPPAPTWASIRGERDALLKSTDWWGVSDRTMSAEETAYRQSLRDLPQTFANLEDVVWPTKP
jgi:hypothetical protein